MIDSLSRQWTQGDYPQGCFIKTGIAQQQHFTDRKLHTYPPFAKGFTRGLPGISMVDITQTLVDKGVCSMQLFFGRQKTQMGDLLCPTGGVLLVMAGDQTLQALAATAMILRG